MPQNPAKPSDLSLVYSGAAGENQIMLMVSAILAGLPLKAIGKSTREAWISEAMSLAEDIYLAVKQRSHEVNT